MLAAAAAVALAPAAQAETLSIAGRAVVLEPPAGHCALSEAETADRPLITSLRRSNEGRNIVLMVFAECENLRLWRRNQVPTLLSHGQFLAPLNKGQSRTVPHSRAEAMRNVAAAVPLIPWQDIVKQTQARLSAQGVVAPAEGYKPLGVLHSDEQSVLMGLILPVPKDPNVRVGAGVTAITLVNEVLISINLYRPFVDESTIAALVAEQQSNIAAFIALNEGKPITAMESGGIAAGFDWHELGISAAIGSAIFVVMLVFYGLFQRLREALG